MALREENKISSGIDGFACGEPKIANQKNIFQQIIFLWMETNSLMIYLFSIVAPITLFLPWFLAMYKQ